MGDRFHCHEGGCHCGQVRFRVKTKTYEAIDCNCSICRKKGFLHLIVPPKQFELLQGQDSLVRYQFNTGTAIHLFCRTCGIHSFYHPRSHPDHIDINVHCLDDAEQAGFLDRFQIEAFDGQNWEANIDALR